MEWQYAIYALPLAGLAGAIGIHRLGVRSSALAGLLLLVVLSLPPAKIVSEGYPHSVVQPGPIEQLVGMARSLVPLLALVAASSLLCLAVSLRRRVGPAQVALRSAQVAPARAGWLLAAVLATLGTLLLVRTLYALYWTTVWDSTHDPWDWLLLIPYFAAALVAGLLALDRSGIALLAGLLYVPLAVFLMIEVYASADGVDFRQLTDDRAAQVQQAVETYYAGEGSYPRDLGQLFPRYALSLPEPVIIYGQDWCYDSGGDYFRLGYVYRDEWYSPSLIGRLYASRGPAPEQPGICQSEIAALKELRASHW